MLRLDLVLALFDRFSFLLLETALRFSVLRLKLRPRLYWLLLARLLLLLVLILMLVSSCTSLLSAFVEECSMCQL